MKLARPGAPYDIKVLDYSFFKNYESMDSNFRSIRPGTQAGQSIVTDIRALEYKPTGEVGYKLRHTEEYRELPQKRACRQSTSDTTCTSTQLYQAPLKLKKDKFSHLQQMKVLMPQEYHPFYDSLAHH